jgi:hypothetical protein
MTGALEVIMPKGRGGGGVGGGGGSAIISSDASTKTGPPGGGGRVSQWNNNKSSGQSGSNNSRNRTYSGPGPGKKPGQGSGHDNNASKKSHSGGPANTPSNSNSRFNKGGGRNVSGPPNPPIDVLTPTVPLLYPTAPAPPSLTVSSLGSVSTFKRFCRYNSSNHRVKLSRPSDNAFYVQRFTDMYKAPLTLNAEIVHKVHTVRLPRELSSATPFNKVVKSKVRTKKKLEPEVITIDDDDEETTADTETSKKKKATTDDDQEVAPEAMEEVKYSFSQLDSFAMLVTFHLVRVAMVFCD